METVKLIKILDILGEAVVAVVGSAERTVTHPASINEAQDESAITFCHYGGSEGLQQMRATRAGVVICRADQPVDELDGEKTFILVENPRLSFLRVVGALFVKPRPSSGIHPTAVIDPEAKIHPSVYIGPFTYAGKCEIGAGTVIHGHVHIHDHARIGCNIIIHAGAVIGAEGFGYERNEAGELEKFPQVGGVIIEDNVEISEIVCVDRGTLGDTIIHEGAKVDTLVHVGHNVVIGRHAVITSSVMIAGGTRIGDYAYIAPSACLRDRISVGERAFVGLGAVVVKDVPDGVTVMGVPAQPAEQYKRMLKVSKALTQLMLIWDKLGICWQRQTKEGKRFLKW